MLTIKNKKGTDDSTNAYDTIEDLVENGEIWEHFHLYQKIATKSRVGEEYNDDDNEEEENKKTMMTTIDLHTDQGFFIAFTLGMTMKTSSSDDVSFSNSSSSSSDGFYVIKEGNYNNILIPVDFNVETDDLVFMFGDGVNQ